MGSLILESDWIEIQSSEIEVNSVGQPLFISKSTGTNFDGFDAAVDAFRRTIADVENDRIDDSPQVILNPDFGGLVGSRI